MTEQFPSNVLSQEGPSTSAGAPSTPNLELLSGTERMRLHASWAIVAIAAVGFSFFCGSVAYHGVVGEWPMDSVTGGPPR